MRGMPSSAATSAVHGRNESETRQWGRSDLSKLRSGVYRREREAGMVSKSEKEVGEEVESQPSGRLEVGGSGRTWVGKRGGHWTG